MIGEGPYRTAFPASYEEEELWLRLDVALEESFRNPSLAWGMAWSVVMDSELHPDVAAAASGLMDVLFGAQELLDALFEKLPEGDDQSTGS